MAKKILLADDSITIQKVIELTFSDEDFDVITVGNGRLALERLPDVRPDIVLCDIIMPEKDGYEVCEQIKANPAYAHVPVLLLTGAFEPFDQERAARAGYDGSLAKPFEPETLIAKVKDLLARAPARLAVAPPPPARPATPPSGTVAPAVLPFPRPSPPAPPAPTPPPPSPAPPSFIPDEPFGGLEPSAFSEPKAPPAPATETFAPVTAEESASLLVPSPPEGTSADAASTVMFRAQELPWSATPVPAAAPPAPRTPPPPVSPPPPSRPEPVLMPEAAETTGEAPVYEEVLEEDLDFGPGTYAPEPRVEAVVEPRPPVLVGTGSVTLPPASREGTGGTTGAFVPVEIPPPPEEVLEAEPSPAFEPEPPPLAPEPAAEFEPGPAPFEPEPAPTPARVREPVPPAPAESFADVAGAVAEPAPPPPPPSEAAAVAVPLEMVEKIAQRVVAQISEKAVREIAWEVIPDLAEALIKQEIERLKAELQKA
jgi:CheY-like chemotaxis protein